jgi:hypothetical protein
MHSVDIQEYKLFRELPLGQLLDRWLPTAPEMVKS